MRTWNVQPNGGCLRAKTSPCCGKVCRTNWFDCILQLPVVRTTDGSVFTGCCVVLGRSLVFLCRSCPVGISNLARGQHWPKGVFLLVERYECLRGEVSIPYCTALCTAGLAIVGVRIAALSLLVGKGDISSIGAKIRFHRVISAVRVEVASSAHFSGVVLHQPSVICREGCVIVVDATGLRDCATGD